MLSAQILTLTLALTCLVLSANKPETECQKFINTFIQNTKQGKLNNIPTIIYSGISTNNPGQMRECQDSANYSYFLIYFNNVTDKFRTYTGACIPDLCNTTTLQDALSLYNVTVMGYEKKANMDWVTLVGVVVGSLWIAVVVVWSCFVSNKEEEVKTIIKKNDGDFKDRNSINSEIEEPLVEHVEKVLPDFKLFIFYEGYQELFKAPRKISIFSPIMFLAVLNYLISVSFSFRLSISENQQTTALKFLNSFSGLIASNTEIALHTIAFIMGLRLAYSAYRINSCKEILRLYFDQVLKKWALLIVMTLIIYAFVNMFTSQPLNNVWTSRYGQDCPAQMWQMWFLFRNMLWDCKACLPWMSLIASEIFFMIICTPFLLIFKVNKKLGYSLFSLLVILSMMISYTILESKQIIYQPYKLMNGQIEFNLDYQANTFVRMGAYFFGLMFGLLMVEGLEKTESIQNSECKLAKKVRRTSSIQVALQIVGFVCMLTCYLLIIPYLNESHDNKTPYSYLILAPFFFIVGLGLFILPSFWQGECMSTNLVNTVFGWKKWVHLDRISMTFYMIGPMIMAYSNYSMQSSIYFDFPTVWTYTIGDLAISYVATLLISSAFEQQFNLIWVWLQYRVYGNESQYSVLVIEQQD